MMLVTLIVLILGVLHSSTAGCTLPQEQYSALRSLYNSTDGIHWKWAPFAANSSAWNFTTSSKNYSAPCVDNWQGISCMCSGSTFSITVLSLNNHGLSGTLPGEIKHLKDLKTLQLDNSMTPADNKNLLVGKLPTELGDLIAIQDIMLNNNEFTGQIPTQLGNLENLIVLMLSSNKLTGSIPTSLGRLSNMRVLYLFANRLVGHIPASLGVLTNITDVWLYSNSLTGTLPPELGSLVNLVNFYVNHNLMTGTIPLELAGLSKIQNMFISVNHFTGTIPQYLFAYPDLQALSLINNCLQGPLPPICDFSMQYLKILYFDGLSSNPQCPGNVRVNKERPFHVNGIFQAHLMSGSIPECLWSLPNLTTLRMSANGFSGTLPEIPESSALTWCQVGNNKMTGTIPNSIQAHKFLDTLDLSSNMFSGTLMEGFPLSLTQGTLGLAVNRLSGELPSSLIQPSNVTDYNVLNGNTFECTAGLPRSDPDYRNYPCGSSNLNLSFGLWMACCGFSLIVSFAISKCLNTKDSVAVVNSLIGGCARILSYVHIWWKQVHATSLLSSSNDIPQTILFLECLRIYGALALTAFVVMFAVNMPSYLGFGLSSNHAYKTVSYLYGWVISCAYLRGIPVVVIISMTLVGLLLAIMRAWTKYRIKALTYLTINQLSSEAATSGLSFAITPHYVLADKYRLWTKFLFPLLLQTANFAMTLMVNVYYVYTVTADASLAPMQYFLLQVAIGSFKLVWSITFIQWATNQMDLSAANGMRHRYMMLLANYIVGPCLATLIYRQECFYYVFHPYPPNTHKLLVDICSDYAVGNGSGIGTSLNCMSTSVITFVTSFTPPFLYTFHCGASLFNAYVPVLLYTYAMSGMGMPIMRFVLLLYPSLRKWITPFSFVRDMYNNKLIIADDDRIVVDGKAVVVALSIHLTVLLTFGLACPLLGIAVAFTIVMEILSRNLIIGKFMYITEGLKTLQQPSRSPFHAHMSLRVSSMGRAAAQDTEPAYIDSSRISMAFGKPDDAVKIMEDSNRDAWSGSNACLWYMIITISCFWSLIFFDMISDQHGVSAGIAVSVAFGAGVPICLQSLIYFINSAAYRKLVMTYPRMSLQRDFSFSKSDAIPFGKSLIDDMRSSEPGDSAPLNDDNIEMM